MVGLLGSILSQESSVKSGDAADQQLLDSGQDSDQKGFADAYTKNIDTLSAAKSGKHIPDSPEPSRNVAQHNGLTSKTLRGGMQIIIGGNEPTPEGLDQYAESQGIDEELLSLLMTGPQSAPILGNQVVANKPSAINRELEIDALISKHMTDVGAPLHNSLSPVALDALKADIDTLIVKHAERFTQSEGVKTPSSQPPAALNALKADIDTLIVKHAERFTQSEGVKTPSSQPPAALNALKADIDTLMVKHAERFTQSEGVKTPSSQPPAALNALKADIDTLMVKHAERFTQSEGVKTPSSQPPAALNALKADIDTLMVKHAERTQSEGVKTPSSQPPAALNALKADIDTLIVKHAKRTQSEGVKTPSSQPPAALNALKADIDTLIVKHAKRTQSEGVKTPSSQPPAALNALKADIDTLMVKHAERTQSEGVKTPSSQPPAALNALKADIDTLMVKHAERTQSEGVKTPSSQPPAALNALKADIDTLMVKHAERFTQSEGVKTPSSQPPAALNALKADIDTLMVKHAERFTQSEGVKTPSSQPPAALNALKADIDTLMVKHADQSIKDSGANRSPQQPMVIAAITAFKDDIEALVLKRHSLNNDMAANSDKTVFSKQGLASSDSFDTQLNQKSSFQPVVSGATFRGGAGLYFSGQQLNSEVRPMKGEDLNKAIEPLNSKQTIKLAQHSVDRIKLPSINLSSSVGEVTARLADSWIPQARLTKVVAAGESGSAVLSQTFVNNVNDLNVQPQTRPDEAHLNGREHLQRQEQYLDISRRLSEALGQRLSSQIQRGAWQVELDLHPKSMGRIEVYLEMKNGELDAVFNASKSIARELLQDSIPRLRAELDQHGIATSFLGLSDGNSKGAGDQTMAQNGHNSDGEKALPTDEKLIASEPHRSKLSDDGLDIIV